MPIKTQTVKPKPLAKKACPMGAKAIRETMERDFAALVDWLEAEAPALSMERFFLPMPPNLANSRLHWRSKLTLKNRYFDMCATLKAHDLFPRIWTPTPDVVNVTLTAHLGGRMDTGNFMARAKFSEDFLVRHGVAIDDNEKHWRYTGLPMQKAVSKKRANGAMPCPCLEWSFGRFE